MSRNRIGFLYLGTTALSVAIAYAHYVWGQQGMVWDAFQYYVQGQQIAKVGLFNFSNPGRTYGYPLFVGIVWIFTNRFPSVFQFAVFNIQLLVFLAASFFGSRLFQRIFKKPSFSLVIYASIVLNPLLLAYTTEVLSDLLSAVLVFLAIIFSVRPPSYGWSGSNALNISEEQGEKSYLGGMFLAFFFAGTSAIVRPSNIPVVLAVALVWAIRGVVFKERSIRALLLVVLGFGIPFVPQLIDNYRAYQVIQPLITYNLVADDQLPRGMRDLKKVTLVIPGLPPELTYENPFFSTDVSTPVQFVQRHPLEYLLTTGIHFFAFFDYDFILPYVADLHPWYRWPLSVANYTFLFASSIGIVYWLYRWLRRKRLDRANLVFFGMLVSSVIYVPLFIFGLVEARYSLPEYILLVPFFVLGLWILSSIATRKQWNWIGLMSSSLVIFVAGSAYLSNWIMSQAPTITMLDMAAVHHRLIQNSLPGRFGERIEMLGYTLMPSEGIQGGSAIHLILAWQCHAGNTEPVEMQAELRDSKGRVWSRGVHDAGYDLCPTVENEQGEEVGGRFTFQLPPSMPPGKYLIYLSFYDYKDQVYLEADDSSGKLQDNRLRVTEIPIAKDKTSITASELQKNWPIDNPFYVDMNEIRLLGYTVVPRQIGAGSVLDLGLYWRARAKPRGDYLVDVQLRDASDSVVFEQSARPAEGTYPTTLWNQGEVLLDWHTLSLPRTLAPGDYQVTVILQDANSRDKIGEAKLFKVSVTP